MDVCFLACLYSFTFLLGETMKKHDTKIGYACMNMDSYPASFQTCRIQNITEEKLYEMIENNILVLENMIDYNIKHNNYMYRISSSLIPFGSSPLNTLDWKHIFRDDFKRIKNKIKHGNMRVSCHPGQYTVINSPSEDVVEASIMELEYHTDLMELLSGNKNHKMILHVGGVYGDKDASIDRFIDVYHKLSPRVKKYLVIENDDRSYTVEDVLYISSQVSVPVIFDNLHHDINPSLQNLHMQEIITKVVKTWREEDGKVKMHYSQQDPGKRKGAHSETIDLALFCEDYKNIYSLYPIDIMLEVKDKNRSFKKVDLLLNPNQRTLEVEWASYKYLVMSKSIASYNQLREMFKNNPKVDVLEFYSIIDATLKLDPSIGNQVNALEHVWGYFKKIATEKEKMQFFKKLQALKDGKIKDTHMIKFTRSLAEKYEVTYLLESYFLSI